MSYEHSTPSYQTTEATSHLLPTLATSLDQVTLTGHDKSGTRERSISGRMGRERFLKYSVAEDKPRIDI